MIPLQRLATDASILGFILAVPTVLATYYQAWKTRQEATAARQGLLYSANCLEFVSMDGHSINLVPLETLHSLPKPGDIVLLPGKGIGPASDATTAAFRVERVEHIYARVDSSHEKHARLVKAVAHVSALSN